MYTITLDGKTLYSPAMAGDKYRVMAPKLSLDVNANGSCTFVLPKVNHLYSAVRRRKSIVTVLQDGEEIFCGRVLDDEADKYLQKSVYCEGVRGYLNDSEAAPYSYKGTPRGLFEKLINEHNEQIEEEKRFVVGNVTIDRADEALECKNVDYWETLKEIDEKLLSAYGGYLKVRKSGGVQYVDWLKDYGSANTQQIRFAVNLIDIKDKNDSADVFTILRPLGASKIGNDGEYGEPLTIASFNGGIDYIQDDEAIAKHGRIWRTHTWAYEEDPQKLLEKGQEYLKIGAELRTITLQAIDMHFLSGSAQAIRIGDKVRIVSQPHGIDLEKVCSRIEIDIANPENTTYTFGEAPRLLTENVVATEEEAGSLTGKRYGGGGGGRSVKEELKDYIRWADIIRKEDEAKIQLLTGEVSRHGERLSKAEVNIDGVSAKILLMAGVEEITDDIYSLKQASIDINGSTGSVGLKSRVNDAEASIKVHAGKFVTVEADMVTIKADITSINNLLSGLASIAELRTSKLYTAYFTVNDYEASWKSFKAVTGGSVTFSTASVSYMKPDGTEGTLKIPASFSFKPSTDYIYYLGRSASS